MYFKVQLDYDYNTILKAIPNRPLLCDLKTAESSASSKHHPPIRSYFVNIAVGRRVGGGTLAVVVIGRSVSVAVIVAAIGVAVVVSFATGLFINLRQRTFLL